MPKTYSRGLDPGFELDPPRRPAIRRDPLAPASRRDLLWEAFGVVIVILGIAAVGLTFAHFVEPAVRQMLEQTRTALHL